MDRLKVLLKASSVPECVVASVILMVVFLITLEMLSRLTAAESRRGAVTEVVSALHACYGEFAKGGYPLGKYTRRYDGAVVEVAVETYGKGIHKLTLTASPSGGGSAVKFFYLIAEKE